MLKRVCDFCGSNEVTDRFKIKQLRNVNVGCGQPVMKWVKLDMCGKCYYRLMDILRHGGLENEQ